MRKEVKVSAAICAVVCMFVLLIGAVILGEIENQQTALLIKFCADNNYSTPGYTGPRMVCRNESFGISFTERYVCLENQDIADCYDCGHGMKWC